MARRNSESLVHDLLRLPWWVNLILAALVYVGLRYGLPLLTIESVVLDGFAKALPPLAWLPASILVMIACGSAMRSWERGELLKGQRSLEDIKALSWQDFERLVGEFYRRQGYSVRETGGGGSDGGIDLILKKDGETTYVQCKRWRNRRVGIKPTKELFATVVAEKVAKGILITSAGFTNDARAFAAKQAALELVSGPALMRMMRAEEAA